MKKVFRVLLLTAFCISALALPCGAVAIKAACIDINAVLAGYKNYTQSKTLVSNYRERRESEVQPYIDRERDTARRAMIYDELREDEEMMSEKFITPAMQNVRDAIAYVAAHKGIDVVYAKGSVHYCPLDITQSVLNELNFDKTEKAKKKAEKKAAKAKSKKAAKEAKMAEAEKQTTSEIKTVSEVKEETKPIVAKTATDVKPKQKKITIAADAESDEADVEKSEVQKERPKPTNLTGIPIQLAATFNKEEAVKIADKAIDEGFINTIVLQQKKGNAPIYRVWVYGSQDMDQAQRLSNKLSTKGFSNFITGNNTQYAAEQPQTIEPLTVSSGQQSLWTAPEEKNNVKPVPLVKPVAAAVQIAPAQPETVQKSGIIPVQIAAARDGKKASEIANKAMEAGFEDVNIIEGTKDGRPIYRVRIYSAGDSAAAKTLSARLKAKGFNNFIVNDESASVAVKPVVPGRKTANIPVQIASSTDLNTSKKVAEDARGAGYANTKVITVKNGKSTLYRVRVFGSATVEDAEALAQELRNKGFKAIVAKDW